MSASAPAGSARRKNGRLVAVCMSDTMSGEGASPVMSHAALVSCIHVPTFETHEASQSARKTGWARGLQADEGRIRACYAARAWPVKYTGPEGVEGIATTDAKGEHRVTGHARRKWQSFMRLFLGLGTGLGSAMIIDGALEPMELAHLPYRKGRTHEDYVGRHGLERLGKKRWRRHVADVAERLKAALEADDVVVGGGNAKLLKTLPPGARRGDNANAFLGGLRLWDDRLAHADGVRAHDTHGRRSRGLGRERG